MKSVISSTYDNTYLFFLPIVSWCWGKLGAETICFMPEPDRNESIKLDMCREYTDAKLRFFKAPQHKKATYAQCARLYGGKLGLDYSEVLITGDIDMAVFNLPEEVVRPKLPTIFGSDLVPEGQYPMCFASATAKDWIMLTGSAESYQFALNDLLSDECENFRGNMWARDQETLYKLLQGFDHIKIPRARPGTGFASLRYDRDDAYILERLSPDTIDFHMNRPGYEDSNFNIIMTILQYHYPNEDFTWLTEYREQYLKFL